MQSLRLSRACGLRRRVYATWSGLTIIAQQCHERGHEFECHCQARCTAEAPFGFASAMSDGGEGAFDGIGGADVLPMLSWEVIEGQQHVAIFGQLAHGFVVFHAIGCDEDVKGRVGIHAGFGLPNIMQMTFGFGLHRLRHRVQNMTGLVEPTALFFRGPKDLAQRMPEPQSTIANSKISRMGEASALQIKQQFAPALGVSR